MMEWYYRSRTGFWSELQNEPQQDHSEEWDEVVHEVELMVERLRNFCNDLLAAENSGALTRSQIAFVKLVVDWALGTAVRIEQARTDATKDETAEEGRTG